MIGLLLIILSRVEMSKSLLIILTLAVALQAFQIQQNSVKAIPWPFTLCGSGSWNIESLTMGQTPARNINDDIDVVLVLL